ncbi:ABI family, member 3a isoform X2, partial [Tachysurus ichikawai]
LEIPAPPPPPPMDCMDGFEEIPPLPPPVDYDISTSAQHLEKVVALYSYEASKPGDLTFHEGDIIYLTKRNDDGWCEGILNDMEGFFPGNYVTTTN